MKHSILCVTDQTKEYSNSRYSERSKTRRARERNIVTKSSRTNLSSPFVSHKNVGRTPTLRDSILDNRGARKQSGGKGDDHVRCEKHPSSVGYAKGREGERHVIRAVDNTVKVPPRLSPEKPHAPSTEERTHQRCGNSHRECRL